MSFEATPLRLATRLGLLGSVVAALVGCSGEPLPPADEEADSIEPVATFAGHVDSQGLAMHEVAGQDSGVTPQGFSDFSSGTVSFSTQAGDGVNTGSCNATQYCGMVDATNATGRNMDNMFVEITSYHSITPAGAAVSWAGAPFTASGAFKSFFVNTNVEAATYGDFAIGQTKSVEFKFNLNAGSPTADNFDFTAEVYASFRRTTASGSTPKKQVVVNACGMTGATTYLAGSDDAEANFELPFPFTLYDGTYDRAVVGSNGYILLYKTGQAAPTAPADNTNLGPAIKPGIYVFWDDLAYDGGDGVCVAVSGTKPNRLFTVTWSNAKVSKSQPAKGTWSTEKITYSAVWQETTDRLFFNYNAPSGGITDFTRGIGATTGIRATRNGGNIATQYTLNRVSPYIPALATDYAARIYSTFGVANP